MSLTVVADYGQIYIYDSARLDSERRRQFFRGPGAGCLRRPLQDALADGIKSRRFVGTSRGLIDPMTPGQYNFKTPMLVEVRQHQPGGDRQKWDHEVDLDLDLLSGVPLFEGSGGSGIQRIKVPPGRYRARVSGRGFVALGVANAGRYGTAAKELAWLGRVSIVLEVRLHGISGGLEVEAGSFVLGVALGGARCPFSGRAVVGACGIEFLRALSS